jgi:hypothetical protein
MQTTLREEINADINEDYVETAEQKTELYQYEIYCSTCGKTYYTDHENGTRIARLIEQGLDNPFLCDYCTDGYEEQAYEER